MDTISSTCALEIARRRVAELALGSEAECAVMIDKTEDIGVGWLFFYNTIEYIETLNILTSLAGNGPILVMRDGQTHVLPTAIPWEQALKGILEK